MWLLLETWAGSWGYKEITIQIKSNKYVCASDFCVNNVEKYMLKSLMLDCTTRLMHWFWIVEPERASTTAHDKATSKMRTLDSIQNPPVFSQAHTSLLPHPFSLLFLKYNICALLKGRVGDDIRPPAQSYFILVWVTGWSGPSVNHLSHLQMGRSLHSAQWTCLGCSWRSPLHAFSSSVTSCNSLPQPHFCSLHLQNQHLRADQSSCSGLSFSDLVQWRSGAPLCFIGDEWI